jgi:hypothetical protein
MIIITNPDGSKNSKKRNVLVTILLSIFLIVDFYTLKTITDSNPNNDTINLTEKINYFYVFFIILDLVFTFFIFKWKKWAFWGTLTISILTFFLNIYVGVNIIFCIAGLIGLLLLFASLQLKSGNVSGWENLE